MDLQSVAATTNSAKEHAIPEKFFKILVIGEMGTGKSTFINYITNYFLDGSLDNLKIAIPTRHLSATEKFPHSEMDISDSMKSKTDICNAYNFVDRHTSNRYLFLDTPGMSDTRGIQQDQVNMENIIDAVKKLNGLSAVVTIINGSMSRMFSSMGNIMNRLEGHCALADNFLNIVILSNTFRHTSNFDLKVLSFKSRTIHPFYLQMSAFSSDLKKLDKRAQEHLQSDWEDSMEEIQKTVQLINSLAPHF